MTSHVRPEITAQVLRQTDGSAQFWKSAGPSVRIARPLSFREHSLPKCKMTLVGGAPSYLCPMRRSPAWTSSCGELRRAQFKVKQARNGDHALGILGTTADIDIVISDVWMPGCTDGVALAAWLRIRRPEVRIVLMCADLPPLAALAADLVVSKPLSEADLVVDLLPLLGKRS